MRGFFLCAFGLGAAANLAGCQLFGNKSTNSEWVALGSAATVECGAWPLGERDLHMSDVKVVRAAKPGFVATGVKRDGSPVHYYLPFDGDVEMERDELVPLALGRGAVLLGAATLAGSPVTGIVRNQEAKATFELRTVANNVVKFTETLTELPVVEGAVVPVDVGAWLNFQRDDNGMRLTFVDWTKPEKITAKHFRTVAYDGQPTALPKADKSGILTLWRPDKADRRFRMRHLGRDGKATEPVVLDVKMEGEVESWSAAAFRQGYYLAIVEGDSLVGQATLRVIYFNWREDGPVIQWQKEQSIKDVHVGEPVFATSGEGLELLLLNWVDDESTIARYQVSTGNLGQPSFSGVFARGARVLEAFADDGDLYTLMRYREENRWTFQVCRI